MQAKLTTQAQDCLKLCDTKVLKCDSMTLQHKGGGMFEVSLRLEGVVMAKLDPLYLGGDDTLTIHGLRIEMDTF